MDRLFRPKRALRPLAVPCPDGLCGALLVGVGLAAVVLIALLDLTTGPFLSCSIFYLLPVAACAWWGGFAHGVLVALAGSFAWFLIDRVEILNLPPVAAAWNGAIRFSTLTLVSSLVARLHASVLREARLARTDSLTGAANARTFYEEAGAEAERARRASRPLTLAYFDVDDFKRLNDRLGHAAGDDCLRHIVRTIQQAVDGSGLVSRLGGDEFALLLSDLEPEAAVALLTRLHAQLSHEMARGGWPVTVSVGAITFLRPAWDVDLLVRQVDALMYGAKRKGKARVEHAVVQEDQKHGAERRRTQRRATARVLCSREVRVRGEAEGRDELATVCDISVGGVGLLLENAFPVGTILVIEPLVPDTRALLARVVRVTADGSRRRHGCALSHRLSAEELGGWLGTAHHAYGLPAEGPSQKLSPTAG